MPSTHARLILAHPPFCKGDARACRGERDVKYAATCQHGPTHQAVEAIANPFDVKNGLDEAPAGKTCQSCGEEP